MAVDRKLLLFIAKLKKISILKTATANDISQAQLSRFFGGKKEGILVKKKLRKFLDFLVLTIRLENFFLVFIGGWHLRVGRFAQLRRK